MDSTSTVRVTVYGVAGLLVPYTISLGGGLHGGVPARQMASGADLMAYNLYTDATRMTVWGDGGSGSIVSGAFLFTVLVLSGSANHTVYGRIDAGQTTLRPGAYTDTITVTISF